MTEESRFPLLLEPVGFAADVDDVAVMLEPVEDGAGDNGITSKDAAPISKALVAGEDHAAFFVALADDLKEQVALQLVERQVADLGDPQALWMLLVMIANEI